ncbi:MAG: very short patch repair endonuclease [Oligoflexus sp.]
MLTREQRSYCMSQIKGSETTPEVRLRKLVWSQGYRYRKKSRLPGRPDLIFPSAKIAVFVDGCFWHMCPQHFQWPKSNSSFWMEKLSRNVARDEMVNEKLNAIGWIVLRLWEHEVKDNPMRCAQIVINALEKGKDSSLK